MIKWDYLRGSFIHDMMRASERDLPSQQRAGFLAGHHCYLTKLLFEQQSERLERNNMTNKTTTLNNCLIYRLF